MPITTDVRLLKIRRTKIVATLGPASSHPSLIRALIEAGVNVFRLNMSHGDHDFHRHCLEQIRNVTHILGTSVAIMADLCGPKIRAGKFAGGNAKLLTGDEVVITPRATSGNARLIPSQYQELADDVATGDRILLDDGNLELGVKEVQDNDVVCIVNHGGILKDHAGINLPGVEISAPSLTTKDETDAQFAVGLGVDYLALSFVRQAADIDALRGVLREERGHTPIVAKIEKPEALKDINAILNNADGIMVARGDLGIELEPEQVPVVQHQLINMARAKCKPVIVATQMLESMIESARPTRAEVSDVANAVSTGADAIMLSGETAVGEFPLEAVRMMGRIARHTESQMWLEGHDDLLNRKGAEVPIWLAVADAVSRLSHDLRAHAVIVQSRSGASVNAMSAARPHAPIIAVTGSAEVCRRLNLLWSVIPVQVGKEQREDPIQLARDLASERGLAGFGETVLLVQGFHGVPKLNTPSLTVVSI